VSVPAVKYGLKHFREPRCLGKDCRFGFGHEPDLQHFCSIRMQSAFNVLGFKHGHHIRSAVSIAVVNDEIGTGENADEISEANEGASLFEHLTHGGIGWNFDGLYGATREEPNAALRVTRQKDASIRIAQRDRDGRNLEQFLAANDVAKPSDVLSHDLKLPPRRLPARPPHRSISPSSIIVPEKSPTGYWRTILNAHWSPLRRYRY
jgi:hypothetical protein